MNEIAEIHCISKMKIENGNFFVFSSSAVSDFSSIFFSYIFAFLVFYLFFFFDFFDFVFYDKIDKRDKKSFDLRGLVQ